MTCAMVKWAFKCDGLTHAQKLVLVRLAFYADERGECWPSQGDIAAECGLQRETVNRSVRVLVDVGLLRLQHRLNGIGQLPNRYFIQCDAGSQGGVTSDHTPVTQDHTPPVTQDHTEPSIEEEVSIGKEREAKASPKKVGSRWVGDVSEEWIAETDGIRSQARLPAVDGYLEAAKFSDFWLSKAGQGGTKLDWHATWRNWIRNAKGENKYGRRSPHDEETAAFEFVTRPSGGGRADREAPAPLLDLTRAVG